MKSARYFFTLLVLFGLAACSRQAINSLFVAKNQNSVEMLNLVEAPPGHLTGTLVISSITNEGIKKSDDIHNVTGDIYKGGISLQVDNGVLTHPTNIIGKMRESSLLLMLGEETIVFRRESRKEYNSDLYVLDHTAQIRRDITAATQATSNVTSACKNLNEDLQSFVKWGNQRIAHVSNVRAWYKDARLKYIACLAMIQPLAVQGIPAWRWQKCVIDIDNNGYALDRINNDIISIQTKEHNWELDLDIKINNVHKEIRHAAHMIDTACIERKQKSYCMQHVVTYQKIAESELTTNKAYIEYNTILPKVQTAIDNDVKINRTGQAELAAIVHKLDSIYRNPRRARTEKSAFGWLGIYIQNSGANQAKTTSGVLVSNVFPRSPADRDGLKRGDIIKSYNGKPVINPFILGGLIATTKPGTSAILAIVRDGSPLTVRVTVGTHP